MSHLPCGVYHDSYEAEQKWWRTRFIKAKMIVMAIMLLGFPFLVYKEWVPSQWIVNAYNIGYYILAALGVQLLIGFCGQITLGHAAFVAVGAYCSAMMVLFIPWPQFMVSWGMVYPISMICAGFLAGLWSVLFGLPSARVKGFYLIMTTMAAQFITVPLFISQYVSQIGGREQAFSLTGALKIGPFDLENDYVRYYWCLLLVTLCLMATGNLLRSKVGRAWVAIRDNDIAAETMGVNIVWYQLSAFFVAGFFAGIAGSFYISTLASVSPEHYVWKYSLEWVGVILIGGVGSIQGLVFGSAFMILVFEVLRSALDIFSQGADWLLAATQTFVIAHPLAGQYLGGVVEEMAGFVQSLPLKISFVKDCCVGLAIILFLIYEPNGLQYRYWQLKNYFNLWPFSYTGK